MSKIRSDSVAVTYVVMAANETDHDLLVVLVTSISLSIEVEGTVSISRRDVVATQQTLTRRPLSSSNIHRPVHRDLIFLHNE